MRVFSLMLYRKALLFFCFWLSAISFAEESVENLLINLTTVKLSETQPVLEQLSATDYPFLLPLFETLLAGNLHFDDDTRELLVEKEIDGEDFFFSLETNEQRLLTSKETTKVRVNNRLRRYLRSAIAKIQLTSENSSERLAAVEALFKGSDEATIATVRELVVLEPNGKVKKAMELVIAMDTAENSDDDSLRISAIKLLGTSLEPDIRNLLVKLADQIDSPEVSIEAKIALDDIENRASFFSRVDTVFFGLSLGSVLLLAAIGLAITFGVMGVINMAHGEMIMLGAYTTYVVQLLMPNHIDYSIWVAIPAAFIVSGLMGVLIERGVIQFLHGRPLETLLATFGISLVLQQLVRTVFSPLNRQVNTPEWMSGSLEINPVLFVTYNRLYIFIFSLFVFAALILVLNKTSLGLNVRAVSQNRNMAKAIGIKTAWVDAMTFGLGSGIAGIAGVALSQLTNVGPNLGQSYVIDSFMVVVFGGVGNLFGTLVAAFTLGLANKIFEPITGAVLASILVLVFIILFIQKRPKGLFPQKGRAAE